MSSNSKNLTVTELFGRMNKRNNEERRAERGEPQEDDDDSEELKKRLKRDAAKQAKRSTITNYSISSTTDTSRRAPDDDDMGFESTSQQQSGMFKPKVKVKKEPVYEDDDEPKVEQSAEDHEPKTSGVNAAVALPRPGGSRSRMALDDQETPSSGTTTKEAAKTGPVIAPDLTNKLQENPRTAGNAERKAGIRFQATYENSAALAKTLGKIEVYTEYFTLLFTQNGLEVMYQDTSKILTIRILIPKKSFVKYENLAAKTFSFVVKSSQIKRLADMCTANKTISFYRNQNGNKTEPMHVYLVPLDGNFKSGTTIRMTLRPLDEDCNDMQPPMRFQYRVVMAATEFRGRVVDVAKNSVDMRMMLTGDSLDISAIDDDGTADIFFSIPARMTTLNDALQNNCCFIEHIAIREDAGISFKVLNNFRFMCAAVESFTRFAQNGVQCSVIELRFGLLTNLSTGIKEEAPMYALYTLQEATAPFTVEIWLAPKDERD